MVDDYSVELYTQYEKGNFYKIRLKNREIDRLQSGGFFLINEAELQEALRIKGSYNKVTNSNKANFVVSDNISPQYSPRKIKTPVNTGV